jgi:hypothetical protein
MAKSTKAKQPPSLGGLRFFGTVNLPPTQPKPTKPRKPATAKASARASARATARASADTTKREIQGRIARNSAEQARVKAQLAELRRAQRQLKQSLQLTQAQSRRNLKAIQRGAGELFQGAKRFVLADPKARRYFDRVTGEYISRREQVKRASGGRSPESKALDNLLGRARERTTAEGRERLRKDVDRRGRQKAFGQAFKEKKARELGVNPSDIKIRGDSDTAREYKALSRALNNSRDAVRAGNASRKQIKVYVDHLIEIGVIDDDDRDDWIDHYETTPS